MNPWTDAPKKVKLPSEVPHTAYQVDFVAVNCGRIVAASKRRIRFKFGYSNQEALSKGCTGQDCRGSEHEVMVVWSLSSGKQAVAFDGKEVFFDVGESTQSKLQYSWKDQDGHSLQVIVHAAPLSTKTNPDPNWRQYDLLIDGHSFFLLPKIFQIGVVPKEPTPDKVPLAFTNKRNYSAPPLRDGERNPEHFTFSSERAPAPPAPMEEFARPKLEPKITPKPAETKKPEPQNATVEIADLLSFDELGVSPAPSSANDQPSTTVGSYLTSEPTPNFATPPSAYPSQSPAFASPQASQQGTGAEISNVVTPSQSFQGSPGNSGATYTNYQINPASPPANAGNQVSSGYSGMVGNNYSGPNPSYGNNQISPSPAYGNSQISPNPTYGNSQMNQGPTYGNNHVNPSAGMPPAYSSPGSPAFATAPTVSSPVPTTQLPPNQSVNTNQQTENSFALVPAQPASKGFDGAVKSLVNLDDIFGTSKPAPITKESIDKQRNDINAQKPIGELKGIQGSGSGAPKKPVMNTFNPSPTYGQQGAQQQYNYGYQQNYQQSYPQSGFQYQQPTY